MLCLVSALTIAPSSAESGLLNLRGAGSQELRVELLQSNTGSADTAHILRSCVLQLQESLSFKITFHAVNV